MYLPFGRAADSTFVIIQHVDNITNKTKFVIMLLKIEKTQNFNGSCEYVVIYYFKLYNYNILNVTYAYGIYLNNSLSVNIIKLNYFRTCILCSYNYNQYRY